MSKDNLQIEDLESVGTEVATETVAKVKKEKTPPTTEELAVLDAALAKIKEFGVSDNFAKVMEMAPLWHDTEANKAVKEEVIAAFGGADKLKNYVDSEFQAELEVIGGIQKAYSIMNNIKSFYARRSPVTGTSKKVKTTQINIGGTFYLVNSDYLVSLASTEREEKKALLLAHEDTKKNESIEIL